MNERDKRLASIIIDTLNLAYKAQIHDAFCQRVIDESLRWLRSHSIVVELKNDRYQIAVQEGDHNHVL